MKPTMRRRTFLNVLLSALPGASLVLAAGQAAARESPEERSGEAALRFATVAGLLESRGRGRGGNTLWQAGRHSYVETDADGLDVVTTRGGVRLRVLPDADAAYDLLAFGVPDDETTDVSDIIERVAGLGESIRFPSRIAVSRTIRLFGSGKRFIFNTTRIHLVGAGDFDEVMTHGSGEGTGYRTVISIGDAKRGCRKCVFSGNLTLRGNETGRTGLCFIAAAHLGRAMLNVFEVLVTVNCAGATRAIFGQGTTRPVAGSFTGSRFAFIETFGDCGAFDLRPNQDDITMDYVRDRGESTLNTDLHVRSYYMYGSGGRDGLRLGSYADFQCEHHFIEGDFRHPVVLRGRNNLYRATVRVSRNFSSGIEGFVVMVGSDDNCVYILESKKSLQGSHAGYIYRYANSKEASGKFEVVSARPGGREPRKIGLRYANAIAGKDDLILER